MGNPNAVDAATYSKPLMAPHTNECKQSVPITSSGSKPITNQDLNEILTLSQKVPCLSSSCLLSTEIHCSGLNGLVSSKLQLFAIVMSDDVKVTHLKTLVSGKAMNAIAEFAYSGTLYKNALKFLERIFGQPKNDYGGSSRKAFELFPSQNAQFTKHYQFCLMYTQSHRCFKNVRFSLRLEEYIRFESICLKSASE